MSVRALPLSGFPVGSFDAYEPFLQEIFPRVRRTDLPDGTRRYEWLERNRLGLVLFAEGAEIRCGVSFLEGRTGIATSAIAIEPDARCRWCGLIAADVRCEQGETELTLRMQNAEGPDLDRMAALHGPLQLCVSAFARSAAFHRDAEAYLSAQVHESFVDVLGHVTRRSPRSLLLTRLGDDGEPVSDALVSMTASVVRSREASEEISGRRFVHCVVETLQNIQLEVVLANELAHPHSKSGQDQGVVSRNTFLRIEKQSRGFERTRRGVRRVSPLHLSIRSPPLHPLRTDRSQLRPRRHSVCCEVGVT